MASCQCSTGSWLVTIVEAVAVFGDLQEVAALGGGEVGGATIVNDHHLHAGDGLDDAFVAAVTAGKSEGFEHARGVLIEGRPSRHAS